MKTLYLLRHAKSAWDKPHLADHDRPLASRGLHNAVDMGYFLREHGILPPHLVYSSTARRARDTANICLASWGIKPRMRFLKSLYLCGWQGMLERLRQTPDSAPIVMLVAHNPDMQDLATRLGANGNTALIRSVGEKFVTGGLVRITLPYDHWSELDIGQGAILSYTQPRELRAVG